MFGRLGAVFGRFGALVRKGNTAGASGGGGDSLLLFNSQGITLLHLGLI